MKPKASFDAAIARSRHFLLLYDLLRDTRHRRIRQDWAGRFKNLMHWPAGEAIVRIDGKDRNSLLIVRQAIGLDRKAFTHEYVSELLRASVVAAVSALDRYMHDLVLEKSWRLLGRSEARVPSELKRLRVPAVVTRRALEKLRKDHRARPGHLVKAAIQDVLHREHTFQKPDDIKRGADMLGIHDFWRRVAQRIPGAGGPGPVTTRLRQIVDRRNQIVHEADLVRKIRGRKLTLRPITRDESEATIGWLTAFVAAIDHVIG